MANGNPRPIIITIIGVLGLIAAVLFFIMGAVFMSGMIDITAPEFVDVLKELGLEGQSAVIIGTAFVIAGLIYLVLGTGFIKGWSIFWYIGVLFNLVMVVACIYSMISGGSVATNAVSLVIDLIILIYLFTPKVKAFFLE